MRKRFFSTLLALALAFSLVACGKGGSDDGNSGISYSEGNASDENSTSEISGETNSQTKSEKQASKDGSFTVYRIDGSKLHFCLKSEKCETMVPKEEYGQAESSLLVMIGEGGNAQLNGGNNYASFGFNKGDEWISVSADYESGYKCFRNMYSATFEGDNLFDGFKDGDSFEAHVVNQNNWEVNDKNIIVSGKIKIEDISEEEFKKIVEEEAKCYAPAKASNEIWAGRYLFDTYDYNAEKSNYGYAIIEVTESGAISVALTDSQGTENFILEEKEFDEAHYDYGDVITGRAKEPGNYSGAELSLNIEPGYSYMSLSKSDGSNYSLYEFKGDAAAPADFVDKDQYGKVDAYVKNIPSSILPGGTEDFAVMYRSKDIAYVYNGSENAEYPCESYIVYAFDVNGVCSLVSNTCCFDNDGAATAFYNYEVKNGNITTRNGNDVTYSYDGYESKARITNNYYDYETYPGMHYAYGRQYDGEEPNQNTMYISKPETGLSFSFEDICRLRMIESGSHRSIDSQDASLYMSFYYDTYNSSSSLSLDVYANDFYSANTVMKVVDENTYLSLGYDRYEGKIYVNEYSIGNEEATVTQHCFICEDFTNPSITFDNYKSQTPEKTVSHKFDMTRVE